ncbi:hypothetical protein BD626DRAFT_77055 [Schizophyllum amplum]|uniref:Uncharacterized protein n=1 Tax=Schizophyllum amplum TaxID=97359 RepID=A0A550BS61_9AGAR|nr:hypothetical protein BD626DRAFT_77055 [Auriculariopsis ampla]
MTSNLVCALLVASLAGADTGAVWPLASAAGAFDPVSQALLYDSGFADDEVQTLPVANQKKCPWRASLTQSGTRQSVGICSPC